MERWTWHGKANRLRRSSRHCGRPRFASGKARRWARPHSSSLRSPAAGAANLRNTQWTPVEPRGVTRVVGLALRAAAHALAAFGLLEVGTHTQIGVRAFRTSDEKLMASIQGCPHHALLMRQTWLGRSGGLAPTSLPLFQGMRVGLAAGSVASIGILGSSIICLLD